jgi:hypothetical protein
VLDVELEPLAPVGMDGALDQLVLVQVAKAVALTGLEDDAGAPHQLRDHDPLGAVDDEAAVGGHHREVAQVDGLLLDLAGGGVDEPGAHEQRRRVGHVLGPALLHRELGRGPQVLVVGVEFELEAERAGEVLDGADVAQGLGQAGPEEPVERRPLDGEQVRRLQHFVEVGEGVAAPGSGASRHGSSSSQGKTRKSARKTGRSTIRRSSHLVNTCGTKFLAA